MVIICIDQTHPVQDLPTLLPKEGGAILRQAQHGVQREGDPMDYFLQFPQKAIVFSDFDS